MFGLGTGELLIILAIVVVLFGARRLPQLGAAFGEMLHGFRRAAAGGDQEHRLSPPDSGERPKGRLLGGGQGGGTAGGFGGGTGAGGS